MKTGTIIGIIGGVVALAGIGWISYNKFYLLPKLDRETEERNSVGKYVGGIYNKGYYKGNSIKGKILPGGLIEVNGMSFKKVPESYESGKRAPLLNNIPISDIINRKIYDKDPSNY